MTMRSTLQSVSRALRKFGRKSDGSLSVEAVMVFPLLAWAYMGMYFFFDAYRQQNVNLKAAYTVSDMLSREVNPIDWADMEGINRVFDYLTASAKETEIRVTVVYWDEPTNRHVMVWSRGTRGKLDLTQLDVERDYFDEIPIMANGDTAILVETWAYFEPTVKIGLPSITYDNLVVTSPRFAPQLCYEVCGVIGSGTAHDDDTDEGAEEDPSST
ncbi:MAG: hypothetical protein AAGO57_01020 [Pseudomonadota bacterium]